MEETKTSEHVVVAPVMTQEDALLQSVLQQALGLHEQTGALIATLTAISMGRAAAIPPDSILQRGEDGILHRKDQLPARFGRTAADKPLDSRPQGATDGRS
jgi:hypothetical protein